MRRCEEMFDNIDGGETLGLGDGGLHYYPADTGEPRDFTDPEQVADAMRIAATFFHVPSLHAGAVGEVTIGIMRAVDKDWATLPQPRADAYCYVVACVCERIGADSAHVADGNHRNEGLRP